MNTIKIIGVILILILVFAPSIIMMMEKRKRKLANNRRIMAYYGIDCSVYTGKSWEEKQLTMLLEPNEQEVQKKASTHVENYMKVMAYPAGEYTVVYVCKLTEAEYNAIRKDLFVRLHGYSYE